MNVFSNIGITELVIILLLALLVVGPERLPELGQKLGKALRDLRKLYDNLAQDVGPELMSIQKTTQELRESVESVRSIPQDMVKTVVKSAELDETMKGLKDVTDSVGGIGQTLSDAGRVIQEPVDAAVAAAQSTLSPAKAAEQEKVEAASKPEEQVFVDNAPMGRVIQEPVDEAVVAAESTPSPDEPAEQEKVEAESRPEEQVSADDAPAGQAHE